MIATNLQKICAFVVQKPFRFCLRLSHDKYKLQNNNIRLEGVM